MSPSNTSADMSYWPEYTYLQQAKHTLLHDYLNAWFPMMSKYKDRIFYIDTHAGRGRHATGDIGSPLRALDCLLAHRSRDAILRNTEVVFIFMEHNADNLAALRSELAQLTLPHNVQVKTIGQNYDQALTALLDQAESEDTCFEPTFAFLDPYSFKLSMTLLNRLLDNPSCELLITLMYRYANMASYLLNQAKNLDELFGCETWRALPDMPDPAQRALAFIELFGAQLHAAHVTGLQMRGEHNELKYFLLHATNHPRGREKIKEAIWKLAPDGSFTAYQNTNPAQLLLLQPEPELGILETNLWLQFAGQTVRYQQIKHWLLDELYLPKHLHQVLRDYCKAKVITTSDCAPRFIAKNEPVVTFPPERPR